jgi:hypothetical protein
MAHTHAEDRTAYYMEQLCTIAVCGLLGGVAVMLYVQGIVRFMLADYLHIYVLWSGIALLALVALRALGLWHSVGTSAPNLNHEHEHCHDHDHNHGEFHGHAHYEEEEPNNKQVHDCGHEHDHEHSAGHTHDCGHEHSWNPGRYILLLLPIVLYFLHLPNAGFSASGISINANDLDQGASGKYVENAGLQITKDSARDLIQVVSVVDDGPAARAGIKSHDWITQVARENDEGGKRLDKLEIISLKGLSVEDAVKKLKGKPGTKIKLTIEHPEEAKPEEVELTRTADVIPLEFNALQGAAYTPASRQYYAGKIVQLVGQYSPGRNDRTFTLVRFKMTCCAADARPLPVMIMLDPQSPENLSHLKALEWVKVTGRIEFMRRTDRDEYVTVLIVASPKDIQGTDPPSNPYLQ